MSRVGLAKPTSAHGLGRIAHRTTAKDLYLKNVLRIGEQCEGLYYYSDKDPVLNVLKDSLNFDKRDNTGCCEICQMAKQTREPFPLSDHKSKKNWGDLAPPLHFTFRYFGGLIKWTRSKGGCDSGNDADSSNDFVATQNEEVATLEENVLSEGNLDQNPSSSQGVQNVKRSYRQSIFPKNYNDFVVESKVKYGLEKYAGYFKVNYEIFCFVSQLNKTREPKTYFEASKYSHWIDAMNQEMNALLRNGTWELVELPEGRKAIGSKWIYKIKFRSSGEIDRYKARLVAQGFGQKEGIDYEETFSPVVKMVTVSQSKSDYSLYTKSDKGVFLSLLVYVDDIIITVVDTDKCICLNQMKYALDLLSEYGMLACKPAKTPLISKLVISNEASNKDPLLENITDYQKLMGKLIYLTNTRPDIFYVVHCLSQFMHSPLTSYLKIAFKILRYLKSCLGLGIHFTKTSSMFLNAYSDADWAKCIVIRKSVTGVQLARALYQDADIYLLDDLFSVVDAHTGSELFKGYGSKMEEVGDRILRMKDLGAENADVPRRRMASRVFENPSLGSNSNTNLPSCRSSSTMNPFTVNLYHDGVFVEKPFEYTHGDFKMIQDQIAPKDQSVKPPFKCNAADYAHSTHENLEDLKDILVGKGTFIGQTDSPIANLCGRFIHEENHHEDDIVDPKFKAKKTICYHLFDPSTPWDQCKPVIGMKFENPLHVKNMLANYGVANGYQLWFMQNDYSKLLMYCGRDVGDSSSKPDHAECSKPVTRNNDRTSQAMKQVGVTKKNMKKIDYKKVFTVHLGCGHPG
ncbi:ribonuclease H-like domain-containing protein [Tanacetum coccineum]|uniref:Ribonuclease H-like domain-containing protein n=1 Tax=Tanacetum coccineum TaxID=301880 RepID=A0ABQ5D2U0_9ASTR